MQEEQEQDVLTNEGDPKPKPKFNPNKKYSPISGEKPPFDPNKPFEKKNLGETGAEIGGAVGGGNLQSEESNSTYKENNLDLAAQLRKNKEANTVKLPSKVIEGVEITDADIPSEIFDKQGYRASLQQRLIDKTPDELDLQVIAKKTGKPIEAIAAYSQGKDGKGIMTEFDDVKLKKASQLSGLVIKANNELGFNDTFENIFTSPEVASQYIDKIQKSYDAKTEREFNSLNEVEINGEKRTLGQDDEGYIDRSLPASHERFYNPIKNRNDQVANSLRTAIGKDILTRIAQDDNLTYEQKVKKSGNLVYGKELKQIQGAKIERIVNDAAGGVNPLNMLSKIFRDENTETKNLNSINAVVETQLNNEIQKSLIYDQATLANIAQEVTEKSEAGTLTDEEKVQYQQQATKLTAGIEKKKQEYKTPKQLQTEYPIILKQSVINDINEFNAIQSGNIKNYGDAGYQGISLREHLKAQGYDMNSQVVKDAVSDAERGVGVKDYSFFGEPIKAIKDVFVNTTKSIGDIVGLRDDVTALSEKTEAELFPVTVSETDEYQLTEKAKTSQNIFNTSGQVIGQGLLQMATAGLGRMAGLTRTASASLGFWGSGTLTSYDQAYKDAFDFIDSGAGRTAYAGLIALSNGASERIFPEAKIFNIPGVKSAISELASKVGTDELTDKLANQLLNKAKDAFIDYGKKYAKNVGQETLEETAQSLFESSARYVFGDKNMNYEQALLDAKNTAVQTAIGTSVIGGMGAYRDVQSQKNISPSSVIYNAAIYKDDAMDALQIGLDKGLYSEQEFNRKVSLLKTAEVGVSELKKAEQVIGRELSRPQKELFVANTTAQKLLNEHKKDVTDVATLERIDNKLENLQHQQSQLLDDKVEFDEFGNVVADTKLSEPIQGLDSQGIPEGDNVPAATNPATEKIFTDFDKTLFHEGKLTELGQEIKGRIANGEDITVLTSRENNAENVDFIANTLGIPHENIKAGLDADGKAAELTAHNGKKIFYDDNIDNVEAAQKTDATVVNTGLTRDEQRVPELFKELQKTGEANEYLNPEKIDESIEGIQSQSLTVPASLKGKIGEKLTLELIARNSVEDINKAIETWKKKVSGEEVSATETKEADRHIRLLEKGLETKAKIHEELNVETQPVINEAAEIEETETVEIPDTETGGSDTTSTVSEVVPETEAGQEDGKEPPKPPVEDFKVVEDIEGQDLSGIRKALVSDKIIEGVDLERVSDKEMMAMGRKILETGEVKPEALVTKIITEKTGVLTPTEVVALITYKRDIDNALQDTYTKLAEKKANGEDIGTLGVEAANLERQISDFDVMAVITAQQQSMAFRLRQRMLDRDYNVVTQIEKYKANNNGEIPADIEAKFRDLDKQLKEVQAKLVEAEKRADEKDGQESVDNIKESVSRKKTYTEEELDKKIQEGVETEIAKLYEELPAEKKSAADKAISALEKFRSKIKSKTYDATLGIPAAIVDLGAATAIRAIKVGKSVAEAVRIGVKRIKDALKEKGIDTWDGENAFTKDMTEFLESEGVSTKSKPKDKATIKKDGTVSIPNEMLRELVKRGITDINDLTDEVHKQVVKDLPNITKRQVRDYITDYGKEINPTADEIQQQLNTAKRVGRLLSQLEDVQNRIKNKIGNKVKLTDKERELKRQINSLSKDIFGAEEKPDEQKLSDAKERTKTRISELERKIKNKDFAKPVKKIAPTDEELVKLNAQKEKLQEQFDNEQYKLELKNRTFWKKAEDIVLELTSGLVRGLVASVDLSAGLVQGFYRIFTNPLKSLNAFGTMFKHLVSQKASEDFFTKLKSTPAFNLMQASKLAVDNKDGKISAKEGLFISNWINILWDRVISPVFGVGTKKGTQFVSNINPYAASERAFSGYVNSIRVQSFAQLAKQLENDGYTFESNPEVFKKAADFVNTTTGRGSLGAADASSKWLNIFMFAPRKVISEIKLFTPYAFVYYARMPKSVRMKALRNYMTFGLSYFGVNALIWVSRKDWGDDDEDKKDHFWDMTSSDFLTHKIGDQRVSIGGGMKSSLVFMARLFTGKFTDQYGKTSNLGERFGKQINTRWDLIRSFIEGKASPALSVGIKKLNEKKGLEVDDADLVRDLTVPIWIQDVKELYKDEPVTVGAFLTMLSVFGANVRTVEQSDSQKKISEQLKDPAFKPFAEKGVKLPEYNPTKIQTKEVNGKVTEHLSDYSEAVQKEYKEKADKYLREELKKLQDGKIKIYVDENGTASTPTTDEGKEGKKRILFNKLTKEQLQNIISGSGGISSDVTKKVKKEVLNGKDPEPKKD